MTKTFPEIDVIDAIETSDELPGDAVLVPADEALQSFMFEAINPNIEAINRITSMGGIACVVHLRNLQHELADFARVLGWDGSQPVFPIAPATCQAFARNLAINDEPAARWFRRPASPDVARVFALTGGANILLNFDSSGWSIEPGTLDSERQS